MKKKPELIHTMKDTSYYSEMCQDITLLTLTKNASRTIVKHYESYGGQQVPHLKCLMCDTGSIDFTPELIVGQLKAGWWTLGCFGTQLDIEVIGIKEDLKQKSLNIVAGIKESIEKITTPYFMRVDADIMLGRDTLRPLLHYFKANESHLGMLGVRYMPVRNHITTSCTLFRTEVAKKLVWQWDKAGCDCLHAINQLRGLGLAAEFHPTLIATQE